MVTKYKSVIATILFFLSLSLLLWLGAWQYWRGLEKIAIEQLLESDANYYTNIERMPPNWSTLAYQRVRLQGEWLAGAVFLMDNRIHQRRVGYEVLSPFRLAGDHAIVLINRGWVETAATLNSLTAGLFDNGDVRGQLYLPKKGFTLGPAYSDPPRTATSATAQWPKIIQYFDAAALSVALGTELQPAVVVLDENHGSAFKRIWRVHAMRSIRHFGYAVQWWGLAVTLIVFGIIWRRAATGSAARATSSD